MRMMMERRGGGEEEEGGGGSHNNTVAHICIMCENVCKHMYMCEYVRAQYMICVSMCVLSTRAYTHFHTLCICVPQCCCVVFAHGVFVECKILPGLGKECTQALCPEARLNADDFFCGW
jgi:hypothetical protein